MRKASRPPEALLDRLEWTVLRRLDGLLQGDYRTMFRGAGLDLADLREYQYHDDVRAIDWNVTARLQVPHVREFREDRELTAWLLVDLSPSLDFGGARAKRELAVEFCGLLARLLTRRGNRVGLIRYRRSVDVVLPPQSSRRHVLHLIDRLQQIPPEVARKRAQPAGTHLAEPLARALQLVKRRSLIFIVSDFFSEPGWEQPLAMLAHRHELIAVRLYDPLEQTLPNLGALLMQDAETGEQLFVDTGNAAFRRRFAKVAEERGQALRSALAQAGVDALELSTADDLADALLRFVDLRKRRTQLAAGGGLPAHMGRHTGRRATEAAA
jgi:uncharacterized protein (DUF58 family)